ncbi:MAG: Na/Pi cotransporter family protein [Clostridia bacterium]
MTFFDFLTFVGGLAFFLFGMNQLSAGLETMVGGKFENTLKKMTSNRFFALTLGAFVTATVQSSSAVTVMLVGLVNSNIMSLSQSVGVIMGSNIGTTITSWILSLVGLEGGNFFTKMLKPSSFAPIVAFIGIILLMFSKSNKKKNIATICLGFAILMTGMSLMSDAVAGLEDVPAFQNLMVMFSNPFMGVLVGAVITAVIQSSSASVGILQSLSLTGAIPFSAALPIIMGQNIGTCITALISSIGTTKNAKRVTAVHIYFNVIGTLIVLPVFLLINNMCDFAFFDRAATPFEIAIAHSAFNIITTALLFPFAKHLQKLAELTVKANKDGEAKTTKLDERFLVSPTFAIAESKSCTIKMAELSRDTIISAINLIGNYDSKRAAVIEDNERDIDEYEDLLGSYLVKASAEKLSGNDSNEIFQLLHTIGDLERLGDHALNICEVAKEMHDKDLKFSQKASEEITIMKLAVIDIVNKTIDSFVKNDCDAAKTIESLEEVIDGLNLEIKARHIKRLQEGRCTIELGFVLTDLLTNLERTADHCSNIAVCQLEVLEHSSFETHDYLNNLKAENDEDFIKNFNKFKEQYLLPKSTSSMNKEYLPK